MQFTGGSRNSVADSHKIAFQLSEQAGLVNPSELVLLKCDFGGLKLDNLCKTGGTRISMSAEAGTYMEVELWELDDHLNPYAPLLNSLANVA
jgi:hypothetical protein